MDFDSFSHFLFTVPSFVLPPLSPFRIIPHFETFLFHFLTLFRCESQKQVVQWNNSEYPSLPVGQSGH